MLSQATEVFHLPEGAPLPPFEPPPVSPGPPAPISSSAPRPSPMRDEDRSGNRDTPTTFYVKPDIAEKPELPERAPDSQKTQMIDSSQQLSRSSSSGPSPVVSNPNPSFPKATNPYTKTTPFAMMPDLSNLPPPGTPLPSAFPSTPPSAPGFGLAPPPAPGSSSGVFAPPSGLNAPPGASTAALPGLSQPGFRPPSLPPQPGMTGSNMPAVNIPGTGAPHPMMTGSNMPRVAIPGAISPMMTGSNLPMANIPGTTGPLPTGNMPPSWMATSYSGAPKPPPSGMGKLSAFWNEAPQQTQIAIAASAAAVFVLLVLGLLWVLVK